MTLLPPLCLTGASGFIGRRLLERLVALGASDVTLLVRATSHLASRRSHSSWRLFDVDLRRDPIPAGSIPGGAVVLHLAAATGSASAHVMQEVNVHATAKLLEAAQGARASHFIFVSSIAAGYSDQRWAPYAASKLAAERLVASGAVPYTLVRPTTVFGPGSPNQRALERLATLALPVLPGQGDVRVQPIHVDDVVNALLDLATEPALRRVITIGGPSVLTTRDLFAAIRRAHGLPPREPVVLPLEPLRRSLALLGALTGSTFPVSAGQFVAFANDSVADDERPARLPAPRVSLDAMLATREEHA